MNRISTSTNVHWQRALALMMLLVLSCQVGCTTLGSLGLPFGNNADKLLKTTDQFRKQVTRPAAWPSELSRKVLDSYILEPGDTVLIEAADFDSVARFPGDQTVMLDGKISLGKYGQIGASGKTLEMLQSEIQAIVDNVEDATWQQKRFEAEKRLRREAEEDRKGSAELSESELNDQEIQLMRQLETELPRPTIGSINVRLISLESKAFYVLGEVNSPGRFVLKGQETVLDAILEAGGLTDQANRHKIVLSRPSRPCDPRVVVPICYNQITQLGDTSTNYQIRPGDRIMVVGKTFLDDVWETICPKQFERCPACGPEQNRRVIPTLDCPSNQCLPTTIETTWDSVSDATESATEELIR